MNLQLFCSTDIVTREKLCSPFSYDNYTYATDGRIIVRVARDPDVKERGDAPKRDQIEDIFRKATATDWMEVPTLPEMAFKKCSDCAGLGRLSMNVMPFHCDCEECDGKGSYRKLIPVDIRAQQFSDEYLEKIKALPGAMISPSHTKEIEPMPFKFDGGCGVLMPMRKTKGSP